MTLVVTSLSYIVQIRPMPRRHISDGFKSLLLGMTHKHGVRRNDIVFCASPVHCAALNGNGLQLVVVSGDLHSWIGRVDVVGRTWSGG